MQRLQLQDWESRKSKSRMISKKSKIWKVESTKKCNKQMKKSNQWMRTSIISLRALMFLDKNFRMRSKGFKQSSNSSRNTRTISRSRAPYTRLAMTPRKTRWNGLKSTKAWMTLNRSWSKTSAQSMKFNNTLTKKAQKATTSTSSKTACSF